VIVRRARGPVLAAALAACAALGTGCNHEARPAPLVEPDEHPPLPPASGTPIGYLVDASGELALSDEQLTKLKAIDDDLANRLATLDSIVRSAGAPVPPPDDDGKKGRGLGFRAGGAQVDPTSGAGGARGGGQQTFPGASTGNAGGKSGGNSRPTAEDPDLPGRRTTSAERATILARAPDERAYDIRKAVASALAMMNRAQQQTARKLLTDHGIDPDTGQTAGGNGPPPAPGAGSGSN